MIAGGGTGGHLFPGLALAAELSRRDAGHQVMFVGTRRGLEARRVPAAGYRLATIEVRGLKGHGLLGWLGGLLRLPRAVLQAWRVISGFRPEVVVGVGGYASAPVVMAAWLRRRPVVLLEQNALPGFTNRVLGRLARAVVVAFGEAESFFARRKVHLLGNPVRAELLRAAGQPLPGRRNLLIFGGSQGARALNQALPPALQQASRRLGGLNIRHQTGEPDYQQVYDHYQRLGLEVRVERFIEDMAQALQWADLVICRAGATTVAELAVMGRPAVLVPYPYAADDHQTINARALVSAGAARLLPQRDLNPERIEQLLVQLFEQPGQLEQMARAAASLGRPDAAARIADLCLELAGNGRKGH